MLAINFFWFKWGVWNVMGTFIVPSKFQVQENFWLLFPPKNIIFRRKDQLIAPWKLSRLSILKSYNFFSRLRFCLFSFANLKLSRLSSNYQIGKERHQKFLARTLIIQLVKLSPSLLYFICDYIDIEVW